MEPPADISGIETEIIRDRGWVGVQRLPVDAALVESPPDMRGFRMETIREGWPDPRQHVHVAPRRAKSSVWDNPWVQAALILVAIVEALIIGVLLTLGAMLIWG